MCSQFQECSRPHFGLRTFRCSFLPEGLRVGSGKDVKEMKHHPWLPSNPLNYAGVQLTSWSTWSLTQKCAKLSRETEAFTLKVKSISNFGLEEETNEKGQWCRANSFCVFCKHVYRTIYETILIYIKLTLWGSIRRGYRWFDGLAHINSIALNQQPDLSLNLKTSANSNYKPSASHGHFSRVCTWFMKTCLFSFTSRSTSGFAANLPSKCKGCDHWC